MALHGPCWFDLVSHVHNTLTCASAEDEFCHILLMETFIVFEFTVYIKLTSRT